MEMQITFEYVKNLSDTDLENNINGLQSTLQSKMDQDLYLLLHLIQAEYKFRNEIKPLINIK